LTPTVSLILTSHNRSHCLHEAIASAQVQAYVAFVLILGIKAQAMILERLQNKTPFKTYEPDISLPNIKVAM
jgi:hypothetical protein